MRRSAKPTSDRDQHPQQPLQTTMQKLVKRTAQARRQAARRGEQLARQAKRIDDRQGQMARSKAVAEVRQNLLDARQARREDWEMGPLAPKRNLGFNHYGVVKESLRLDWSNRDTLRPPPAVVEERCAWAGGSKQLNLAPKDRIVVLEGPDKGKIDRIHSVQAANGTVVLENCRKVAFVSELDPTPRLQGTPVSIASIRLVYPLRNPKTGLVRDVIINQLQAVRPNMQSDNMTFERWKFGYKWDRLVPSLNIVVPWPQVDVPQLREMPPDTVRAQVEERTFIYRLLSPPMPLPVLDELRNKYSRFRTRHEPAFIARKEAEEAAKKQRLEPAQPMITPLQEFHQKQRELRLLRPEPELTDGMLEKIGQIMTKNKAIASGPL